MKLRIAMLLLIPALAWAGPRYIFLGVREDIGAADRAVIIEKLRDAARDLPGVLVKPAMLPRWRQVAATNLVWRIVCMDKEKPHSPIPPLDITRDQFEAWKDAHLTKPNLVRVLAGDGPQALRDAGLEPVPDGETP